MLLRVLAFNLQIRCVCTGQAAEFEVDDSAPATEANMPELPCIPQATYTATTAIPTRPSHAIRCSHLRDVCEVSSDNDCVSRLPADDTAQ